MTKDDLKHGLGHLIAEASHLETLLFQEEPSGFYDFIKVYQSWYTKALKVVEFLAKDRLEEFIGYYRIDSKRKEVTARTYVIQDYVIGIGAKKSSQWTPKKVVYTKFVNQVNILESLFTRIDSVFADIQGIVLSQVLDKELESATNLQKINVRAAGALAGVVLESHLQKVASNHSISSKKKNPSIADLNDLLKNENVIDTPTWRKVQYLGDLRNLCSHKKNEDPTEFQLKELIDGVNGIIKTVF